MIKMQSALYVGRRARRSISRELFSENGAFCVSECANEMEMEVSGSTCQKKERKCAGPVMRLAGKYSCN